MLFHPQNFLSFHIINIGLDRERPVATSISTNIKEMPPKKRPRREDERKDEDSETPPKPKRPLTAYNIFSQLERNYILQSDKDDPPVLPKSVDEDTSSRPEKYRDVIMPKNWFKVGKIKPKRRERENHGKISFIELTKEIAKRWNEADFEVKQYCRDVAGKELERYKKAKADFEEKYGNDTATNVKKEIETGQRKKHKSRQANKKVKDEVSEETNDEEAEEERKSSDDDRKLPASKNDCKYTSTANNKATASATAAELNEENSYSNVLGNVDCSLDAAGYRGIPQLPPIYHSTNEFVNHPPRAEISASSFAHSQSSANNANRERQGVEAEGEPLPFEPLSMNSNYAPNNSSSSTNNWNSNYPVDPEFGADFSEFLSRVLNNDEDDNGSPFSSSHSTSTPENEDENESMHLAYDYFSSARSQSRNSDSSDEAVDV